MSLFDFYLQYFGGNKLNAENQAKYFGWDFQIDSHVWRYNIENKWSHLKEFGA